MTSSVASSSSSAIIKSLTGAQIDIQELATNLTAATRAPQQAMIDARSTAAESKISAIGKIQASAKVFQDALVGYGDPQAIQYQPTSSDSSIASFSFRSYYQPSEVDFSFKVTSLASENRVSFPGLAPAGNFALKTNSGVVETSYNSLFELTSWIKTQTGFSTTILNSRDLILSKGTGASNNFTAYAAPSLTPVNGTTLTLANLPPTGIVTLPGVGNPISYSSLSDLATKVSQQTGNLATLTGANLDSLDITFSTPQSGNAKVYSSGLSSSGTDATIEANGQTYTSSSNRFSTLITGVNIDVTATSNTDVRLTTARNTDKFVLALKTIVDGYNDLLATIKQEMNYDPDVTKRGGLANDSVARDFLNQIRRLTTDTISGYSSVVPTITLAQVGLITNRDGTLQLDTYKIDQIAQNNPEQLEAAVASNASSKGAIDKMKTLIDTVLGRSSSFQTLYNKTNTTVKNKIQDDTDRLNEQMDALKQRYLTQFIAMQKIVLQSQKTQESLTNYMTSWTAGLKG